MAGEILGVRVFAGSVDSASPEFRGLSAPASLTLIEREGEYECRFVFFVGTAVSLSVRVPKAGGAEWRGTTKDPRGWEVGFAAELRGGQVIGAYVQPHDRGAFVLEEV